MVLQVQSLPEQNAFHRQSLPGPQVSCPNHSIFKRNLFIQLPHFQSACTNLYQHKINIFKCFLRVRCIGKLSFRIIFPKQDLTKFSYMFLSVGINVIKNDFPGEENPLVPDKASPAYQEYRYSRRRQLQLKKFFSYMLPSFFAYLYACIFSRTSSVQRIRNLRFFFKRLERQRNL